MTIFVSRETMKLPNTASAVDGFYVGHIVTLTKIDATGKEFIQEKEILAYNGANRIATIEGIWEAGYHPKVGDAYSISPKYVDNRVSINPAIIATNYITSKTYGRGLDPIKDLDLKTWLESARICDTRSDIYVKFTGTAPSIGAVYTIGSSIWQGTVAEIINGHIRFTDNIGKLTYKWNNYRTYTVGQLVHNDIRLYKVSVAGVKITAPVHTTGTVNGLEYLSTQNITLVTGTGPATIPIAVDGNPVRFEKNGIPVSGYSLYDSDGIDYFRLIGWDTNDQRSVTRHQVNMSIDTAQPLFDNMNNILEHFGGILRYTGDKYILEVEQPEGVIGTTNDEPRNIDEKNIIGRITISDDGIKNSYNSLTVSYGDPANKFEARNISFFNSNFLKADRNVPKKGSVSIPGITNYYNARLLADKFLNKSRFGLSINMNIAPRGVLLLPGKVIQLQYPRYGWVDKKFRIENLTHNDDCTVDISAREYDDSFYTISNITKPLATGLSGTAPGTALDAPIGLVTTSVTAGNEQISAIDLSWQNAEGAQSASVVTQIYASGSPNLYLDIDSITGGQTLTTMLNPHGLVVGQTVTPIVTSGTLLAGTSYYVKSITANTFTLSLTRDGAVITTLTNTTTNFTVLTADIIAEVPPTTTRYLDSDITNLTGDRVEKYYWLRYKIDQV